MMMNGGCGCSYYYRQLCSCSSLLALPFSMVLPVCTPAAFEIKECCAQLGGRWFSHVCVVCNVLGLLSVSFSTVLLGRCDLCCLRAMCLAVYSVRQK